MPLYIFLSSFPCQVSMPFSFQPMNISLDPPLGRKRTADPLERRRFWKRQIQFLKDIVKYIGLIVCAEIATEGTKSAIDSVDNFLDTLYGWQVKCSPKLYIFHYLETPWSPLRDQWRTAHFWKHLLVHSQQVSRNKSSVDR